MVYFVVWILVILYEYFKSKTAQEGHVESKNSALNREK